MLEGPEGLGQWKQLHAHLVARRNKLVVQLGQAFQVRLGVFVFVWVIWTNSL